MQIETYEIEEIKSSDASTMAADSEALEICRKLGLEGQLTLADPETDTRFPYPKMSAVQDLVYKALFPQCTKLEQFQSGIIPLRILQVAAFCKESGYLHHIEVWHTQDVKKDPILVGAKTEYGGDKYLLGRWGDALESFEALQEKAVAVIKAKLDRMLVDMQNKATARLAGTDSEAHEAVLTGQISWPSYYA